MQQAWNIKFKEFLLKLVSQEGKHLTPNAETIEFILDHFSITAVETIKEQSDKNYDENEHTQECIRSIYGDEFQDY